MTIPQYKEKVMSEKQELNKYMYMIFRYYLEMKSKKYFQK